MRRNRRGISVLAPLAVIVAGAALLLGRGADRAEPYSAGMQLPAGVADDSLRAPGVPEAVGVFMENGQAWRAARVMRDYLRQTADPSPEALLIAAQAEAGWGGWSRVREYLQGRAWLAEVHDAEGWYWLGRALEEEEEWQDAWEAYDRYLGASRSADSEDRRAVARLRQGLVLLRLDRPDEAARLLTAMRQELP